MHPALDLARTRQLPTSLRPVAEQALDGGIEVGLLIILAASQLPAQQHPLPLPTFYAILDPAKIGPLRTQSVAQQVRSLRGIRAALRGVITVLRKEGATIPVEVLDDLWPRLWRWVQFLHRLYQAGALPPDQEAPMSEYTELSQLFDGVFKLAERRQSYWRRICGTPGFCAVFSALWLRFLDARNVTGLNNIAQVFDGVVPGDFVEETTLRGLADGVGGISELASLLVRQLDYHFSGQQPRVEMGEISILMSLMPFLRKPPPALRDAYAEHGLVPALVRICCALFVSSLPAALDLESLLDDYVGFLKLHLATGRFQDRFVEALDAGLLLAILSYARHFNPEDNTSSRFLVSLLDSFLPRGTVYHSVLVQLRASLRAVPATLPPMHPQMARSWTAFVALVRQRLEVLEQYESGELLKWRVCDNLVCGTFRETSDIQRCSRCHSAFYCNATCQRADFTDGGHKRFCKQLKAAHEARSAHISSTDYDFLRAFANYTWAHNYNDVFTMFNGAGGAESEPGDAYILLDFTRTEDRDACKTTKIPASALAADIRAQVDLELRRRGDKLQMHLVGIPSGATAGTRWFALPLRTHRELDAFREAGEEGEDEADVEEEMERLLEKMNTSEGVVRRTH
ncbi:MYND-type domain-containing protein [Mycena kentingensis (nom. inval.)]|nr:MYND-type domain-containing protein [Mycena kentingensis (nom. inval.)]